MSQVKQSTVIKLKAASALAQSLADDFENGKLWEDDLQKQASQIITFIREAVDLQGGFK